MFWKTHTPSATRPHKLILHIGDHKTGSTSIQYALATGRCVINGATLSYPCELNHNSLKPAFLKPHDHVDTLNKLAQTIATTKSDFTILSAEALEGTDPKKIDHVYKRYLRPHINSIQIISYVRPHAGRITSSCSERIKVGVFFKNRLGDFFESSLTDRRFFYTPRFCKWRDHFGQSFTLRPMVRDKLHEGSVIDDFLHYSLEGTPFTLSPSENANESLSLRDLMVIKLIQTRARTMPEPARLGLGWSVARHLGRYSNASGEKLRPHKALATRMAEVYMDDARAMDTTFFDGEPLLQNDLRKAVNAAPADEQSLDPADHFSDSEQRQIMALADTISEMFDNRGKPWSRHFRERRVQALREET